jgi:hypothetical protein
VATLEDHAHAMLLGERTPDPQGREPAGRGKQEETRVNMSAGAGELRARLHDRESLPR